MTYLWAIVAGIAGAAGGYVLAAAIGAAVAGWLGMSDFEGERGMFAAFVVGPAGGLLGMIGAAWAVLRRGKGRAPWLATARDLGLVVGAIALLVAAGIIARLYSIDTYTNEAPPRLEFELRLPAAMAVPPRAKVEVELHTDKNVGSGQLFDDWSERNGYQVIGGSVDLAFKTRSRILVVSLPDQPTRLFRLPLLRDPSSTPALGDWQRADHIDVRSEAQPRTAPADDPVEVRYRVRRAGED